MVGVYVSINIIIRQFHCLMLISTGFRSGCSTDQQLLSKYIDFKLIRIDYNFGLSVYLEKNGCSMDQKAVYMCRI